MVNCLKLWITIPLIWLTCWPASTASSQYLCPLSLAGKCWCDLKNFTTNCTNANITEISSLHDIPIETKILVISGNTINRFPKDVFGVGRDQPKPLEIMDLSNNSIKYIHGKSFRGFDLVRKLFLNNNQILITGENLPRGLFRSFRNLEELHMANAFADTSNPSFLPNLLALLKEANLTQLRILNLESNGIHGFPDENVFCSLLSLQKLFLAGNQLDQIRFNFNCNPSLRTLDLSYNSIKSLDNISTSYIELFPFHRALHINMTGNPFQCDCTMEHFLTWLKRTPFFLMGRGNYLCYTGYPLSNVHRPLVNLNLDDLQCDPAAAWSLGSSRIEFYPHILLTIITVTVILLVAAILYKLRSHFVDFCLHAWKGNNSKRYSALRRDEKSEINSESRVIEISV